MNRRCRVLLTTLVFCFAAAAASAATFEVNTGIDFVDPEPGDGICGYERPGLLPFCSLRAAIQQANAFRSEPHEIILGPGVHLLWIRGADEDDSATGDLDIFAHDLRIVGAKPPRWACPAFDRRDLGAPGCEPDLRADRGTVVHSIAWDRVFQIHTDAKVTIEDLAITGGRAPDQKTPFNDTQFGGGVRNGAMLTLRNVALVRNDAPNGGGLYSFRGAAVLDRVTVMFNRALLAASDGCGGGITNHGLMRLSRVHIAVNDSAAGGGGLCNDSGYFGGTRPHTFGDFISFFTVEMYGSLINGNSAETHGGGITTVGSTDISHTIIVDNVAEREGGGIHVGFSRERLNFPGVHLFAVDIERNHARGVPARGGRIDSGFGGGIYAEGPLFADFTTIRANTARWGGGVAHVAPSWMQIRQSLVHANRAVTGGGVFSFVHDFQVNYAGNRVPLEFFATTVSGNSARDGGGIYVDGDFEFLPPEVALRSVTLAFNGSEMGASNIQTSDTTLFMSNTIIAGGIRRPNCSFGHARSEWGPGRNLEDRNDCALTGPDFAMTDPLLDGLEENGGPTMTHALRRGSPAIDTGASADFCDRHPAYPDMPEMAQDQRGVHRIPPPGGGCDIGAYESVFELPAWVAGLPLYVEYGLFATTDMMAMSVRIAELIGGTNDGQQAAAAIVASARAVSSAVDAFIHEEDKQKAGAILKDVSAALGGLNQTLAQYGKCCGNIGSSLRYQSLLRAVEEFSAKHVAVLKSFRSGPSDNPKP